MGFFEDRVKQWMSSHVSINNDFPAMESPEPPADDYFSRAQNEGVLNFREKWQQSETEPEGARPVRQLIAMLAEMPVELVQEVSPETISFKERFKLPLVFMMLTAGIQNAYVQVFFKYFGEIGLTAKGDYVVLRVTLVLLGCIFGAFQFLALNVAMKYYNQVDVAPMQESFIIIARIAVGLFLMNEARLYSALEILGICGSTSITIYGIYIIA